MRTVGTQSLVSSRLREKATRQAAAIAAVIVVAFAGPANLAFVRGHAEAAQQTAVDNAQIQVLHVQGNVYMLAGAGGNTTVQAGDGGVLVVDTQPAELSAKLLAAIRTISAKPIHYLINTSVDDNHIGGNENLAKAGPTRPIELLSRPDWVATRAGRQPSSPTKT